MSKLNKEKENNIIYFPNVESDIPTERKTLEKIKEPLYNDNNSGLACHQKEDSENMASHLSFKGCLCKDHGIWMVKAWTYDPNTKRRITKTKSTGYKIADNTKRKAQQAMKEIMADIERDFNTPFIKKEPLFSEYVLNWVNSKKELGKIRENSIKSYNDYINTHILPYFGDIKVKSLNYRALQDYCNYKLKSLSPNSIRKHLVVIKGALEDAIRDGIIENNPTEHIELPNAAKFKSTPYTREELITYLESVQKEGEPIYSAVLLASCYALRRSEICGLRWDDIDFEKGLLYVRNTKVRNGSLVIEAERTKTKKSRRTITLVESTIPYLLELKQLQIKVGLNTNKVCCWMDGHDVDPNYVTKRAQRLMQKCGLRKIRLHDLRHTVASLLAEKTSLQHVQGFLGHENVSTTANIYVHLSENGTQEASNIMNDILKNSVFCSENCSETA